MTVTNMAAKAIMAVTTKMAAKTNMAVIIKMAAITSLINQSKELWYSLKQSIVKDNIYK